MTNSLDQLDDNDQALAKEIDQISFPEETGALLMDADGLILSKGAAAFQPDGTVHFRPVDEVTLGTLQIRAKTLFLTESRKSLGVAAVDPCQEGAHVVPHFHVTLS